MGISAGGIGSGIPVQDIIDQLVAATRLAPDRSIKRKEIDVTTQLSAYTSLKSMLTTFSSSLENISKQNGMYSMNQFIAFDCKVTNNPNMTTTAGPIISVTASDDSAVGSYSVEVEALAVAQQLGTAMNPGGSSAVIGTGTMTIKTGENSFDVVIDSSCETLAGIANAINHAAGNENYVTANILNVDDGSQLILTSTATGLDNKITINVNDSDGDNTDANGLSQLAYNTETGTTNLTELRAAVNASIRVNGAVVTSQSNTITNAINNTVITLNQASPGNPATLKISLNPSEVTTKVKAFIDSYNELIKGFNSMNFYNPATKEKGSLSGDPLLYDIQSQITQVMNAKSTEPEAIQYFAMIGITINSDNTLTLDEDLLNKLVAKDPVSIAAYFIGTENGIGADGLVKSTGMIPRLINTLTPYTRFEGVIDQANKSLNERLTAIDEQKVKLDRDMEMLEMRLKKQFGAMDAAVAKMKQTSSFITQQLSSLPNFSGE